MTDALNEVAAKTPRIADVLTKRRTAEKERSNEDALSHSTMNSECYMGLYDYMQVVSCNLSYRGLYTADSYRNSIAGNAMGCLSGFKDNC